METLQEVARTDTGRSIVNVNEEEVRNHVAELVVPVGTALTGRTDPDVRHYRIRLLPWVVGVETLTRIRGKRPANHVLQGRLSSMPSEKEASTWRKGNHGTRSESVSGVGI